MADQVAEEFPLFEDDVYEDQCEIASFWTGSRLLVAGSLFLYGTFVFAYFYLRALNNHNDWRVGSQTPSVAIGTVVAILVVASALVHYLGARRLQIGGRADWLFGSAASMTLMVVACGLQVWQMTRLPFHAGSSGYTSVFVAMMPVYIIYMVGSVYWLETLAAQAVVRGDTVFVETLEGPMDVPKFGAQVEGFIVFSGFMALMAIMIYVLFYVL
jgi:heme/copper-type cytochrome/quinol oxidase subunit 3